MDNKPTKVILHHTADSSQGNQFEKVNEWHKHRFSMQSSLGIYIGYHYFIERNGKIIKCRQEDEEGAHTKGQNFESVGICLAGNFDFEAPTEAQRYALQVILGELAVKLNVYEVDLKYHWDFSDTHCPGFWFKNEEWQKLIENYKMTFYLRLISWLKIILGKKRE